MKDEPLADDVAKCLRRLNQAWLNERFDELGAVVDEGIVCVTPGFRQRIVGREPYVEGHRDFMREATVHEFTEEPPDIDVLGSTAVATYRYTMEYERAGTTYRSTGRDLYVFGRSGSEWLALWRTMLDIAEEAVETHRVE